MGPSRHRRPPRARRAPPPALALGLLAAACLGGCGASAHAHGDSRARQRAELVGYLHRIEPLRLGVNRLLEGADPILEGFHARRLSAKAASRRMEALERRFAAYTVEVAAIEPASAQLRAINAPYAHTYVLEDSYLAALANGISEDDFDALPDTQAEQRAAIVGWRTQLTVLARRLGVSLPGDLQLAGRGEIAPSPGGS
ncbi:MAG TPA: hypothetical protein VGY13_14695 [Solirubrobacteraceae bacterium]|jgi:hypothetical protein|nr:hypothetical protein [Solirubrobacteraceae bacterium]